MTSLLDDKELWYKYGIDYDEVTSQEGDALTNLLEAFLTRGRKNHLSTSLDILMKKSVDEIKQELDLSYAKWLWSYYKTGKRYESPPGFTGILNDPENGIVVESYKDLQIIWTLAPHLLVEGDRERGIVFGKKLLFADSIVLNHKNGILEVRSTRKGINFIQKKLDEIGAKQIESEEVEREVDKSIEELLLKSSEQLRVTNVKFIESSLPDKSKLIIANDLGIHNDIEFLKGGGAIPDFSITDVKSLELKVVESGKKFVLKIKLEDEGYLLEIDDKQLDEVERQNIRTLLARGGLEISVKYKYQVHRNKNTIFHKILSGATRAHEEYFARLPREIRDYLKALCYLVEVKTYVCRNCKRENSDPGTCVGCGSKDLRENKIKRIKIDEPILQDAVFSQLSEIGKVFEVDDVTYSKIRFTKSAKSTVLCEFTKTDTAEPVANAIRYKFFIIPFGGKGQISSTVDEYLRYCSLVTYGDAIYKERGINQLGSIDLFKLITSDVKSKRKLFHDMIKNSLSHMEDRILPLASDANSRLKEKGKLTAKQFERDVFYLLKRMFPLSERFGRIGSRESDGLVIFTDDSGDTVIASYDAKHSESLYKLDTAEQDKAARYILDETMDYDVREATENKGVTAHLIISNSLNTKNLDTFANGIRSTLKLTKEGSEIKCPIVFLELPELMKWYEIYTEYSTPIKGDVNVHRRYHELSEGMINADKSWKKISDKDVTDFKGKIMQAVQKSPSLPHWV